eukprot:746914-Hanusia_phi.AAC.1
MHERLVHENLMVMMASAKMMAKMMAMMMAMMAMTIGDGHDKVVNFEQAPLTVREEHKAKRAR